MHRVRVARTIQPTVDDGSALRGLMFAVPVSILLWSGIGITAFMMLS